MEVVMDTKDNRSGLLKRVEADYRKIHPTQLVKRFALLALFLLTAGCVPVAVPSTVGFEGTSSPPRTGRETPETLPADGAMTLTPAGGAATSSPQGQVQEYASFGFRFSLPPGFHLAEQPVEGDLRLALGITREGDEAAGYPRAPVGLRVFEKAEPHDLLDWFSGKVADCFDSRGELWRWDEFIAPTLESQEEFRGNPTLRWTSGCWPVPSEIVVARGRWVITLDYLLDYLSNYEPDYRRILDSLEFFEPAAWAGATLAPPTPAPQVCLDEAAQPVTLPPREGPLEVRFTSHGDLWVWQEGNPQATRVTNTGNVGQFAFSPDGQVIAFRASKMYVDEPEELWVVARDGSDLRRLLTDEQVKAMAGEPARTDEEYFYALGGRLVWLEGERRLGFEVQRGYDGIGGCCEFTGHFQVDVDSGEVSPWTPPKSPAPAGLLSPDGRWLAIASEQSLSLADVAGRVVHPDVLTYEAFPGDVEGPHTYRPVLAWSGDSTSLYAIVLLENFLAQWDGPNASFAIWQVPVDGSPARQLRTLSMVPYTHAISPNQAYLAYLLGPQPMSNNRELHLATVDGSRDVVYARGHALEFGGWAPDGVHFVYTLASVGAPQWGSLCGGPQPLLDPQERRAGGITWVDAARFLFVANDELRLGQFGNGSILIGQIKDGYFEFDR
jgi:hypothetical protein